MEVQTAREAIERKIKELEDTTGNLLDISQDKAQSSSQYDRELALTIIKLKNGIIETFEGFNCKGLPATLITHVAKGICYKAKFDLEANESGYKATITTIESLKAQLNGYQSINKFHD